MVVLENCIFLYIFLYFVVFMHWSDLTLCVLSLKYPFKGTYKVKLNKLNLPLLTRDAQHKLRYVIMILML